MKLTVQTQHLNDALSKILSVVDKKNPRPILTQCLFTAHEDGQITLEATDLEVSSRVTCKAQVTKNGTLCLNPKNLFDLIREMPNRKLELETTQDGHSLKLSSGQINISLLVSAHEDFQTFHLRE